MSRPKQENSTFAWLDPAGKTQPIYTGTDLIDTPRFSPDGRRLAVSILGSAGSAIWVRDLARETQSRLTFLKNSNYWPVWTPDGKGIIFKSTDAAEPRLYYVNSDGTGAAHRLTDGKLDEESYSISPDGRRLAFSRRTEGGSRDLYTAALEGDAANVRARQS